jgi:hypothetical protein
LGRGVAGGGHTGDRRWWPPRLPVHDEGRLRGEGGCVGELEQSGYRGEGALAWLGGGLAPDLAVAALVARTAECRSVDGTRRRRKRQRLLLRATGLPACDHRIDGDVPTYVRRPR